MRKQIKLVFDEHLQGPGPFYTSSVLNDLLGRYDQLAIQATVDSADAAGSLTVRIQHCADGRHFVDKNSIAEITGTGTGPGTGTITPGKTNLCTGSDQGLSPSLGYVRLQVRLVGTTRAHVKIHVTMRDQSDAQPVKPGFQLRIPASPNKADPNVN